MRFRDSYGIGVQRFGVTLRRILSASYTQRLVLRIGRFNHVCVCLCVCMPLPACLPACLPATVCPSVRPSVCLSGCLFVWICMYVGMYVDTSAFVRIDREDTHSQLLIPGRIDIFSSGRSSSTEKVFWDVAHRPEARSRKLRKLRF